MAQGPTVQEGRAESSIFGESETSHPVEWFGPPEGSWIRAVGGAVWPSGCFMTDMTKMTMTMTMANGKGR